MYIKEGIALKESVMERKAVSCPAFVFIDEGATDSLYTSPHSLLAIIAEFRFYFCMF